MKIQDVYRPIVRHFRRERVKNFYGALGIGPTTSILDVGGNSIFWSIAQELNLPRPKQVTILNICAQEEELPEGMRWLCADATAMPFADGQFEVAFSNSVIEHLATAGNQAAMASEIRRVANKYWIQTPDPRFPVEPHYLTPFVHWLPKAIRRRILRNGTIWGFFMRPSPEMVDEYMTQIRLIPHTEFRAFFPDAQIIFERFVGLPKSMMAVRR